MNDGSLIAVTRDGLSFFNISFTFSVDAGTDRGGPVTCPTDGVIDAIIFAALSLVGEFILGGVNSIAETWAELLQLVFG